MKTNEIIKEYLTLCDELKSLEKKKSDYREMLLGIGEHRTDQFEVKIVEFSQERPASLDMFVERFGRGKLRGLINKIEVKRLNISEVRS